MRAILIGNGYDLYYGLPTRYIDFLHTADFLISHKRRKFDTLGEIFAHPYFIGKNTLLDSFTKYKDIYYKTQVNQKMISSLIEKLDNNLWFMYFKESFDRELGWIDFEKEIRNVVNSFQALFECKKTEINHNRHNKDLSPETCFILNSFGIFEDLTDCILWQHCKIKNRFLIEFPHNSSNTVINKELIAKLLIEAHKQLSQALALYMKCFVDDIVSQIDLNQQDYTVFNANIAITLNYTHTYEVFNKTVLMDTISKRESPNVYHIHGNVDSNIVLGINSDDYDKAESTDTVFASFKKYFQRVLYRTDTEYMEFVKTLKKGSLRLNLSVVGHSLDITDRDIIKELFSAANTITIFYYSENSMAKSIKNLISIFGIEEFNKFRFEKELTFFDMNDAGKINELFNNQDFEDAMAENYCPIKPL